MTAPLRAKPGTTLRLAVARGYLVVTKAAEGVGLDARVLAKCEPYSEAPLSLWCRDANAYPKLVAVLRDLTLRCDGDEGVRADGSNIETMAAHAMLASLGELESE